MATVYRSLSLMPTSYSTPPRILSLLLPLLLLTRGAAGDPPPGKQCPQAPGREETCVCQTDNGIIDLTPLSSSDGKPRFSSLQDNNDDKLSYSYNPCRTFDVDDPCKDVYICQFVDGGDDENLAPALSEQMWIDVDGTPYVYYINPDNQNRESFVYLTCNHDVTLEETTAVADGEIKGELHYYFNITSCEVCPGGCQQSGTKPARHIGYIGLVLIILVILVLITYFVVGALVNKFHKNASGTDVFPNKQFWLLLPYLVKDGFVFTFSPCYRFIRDKIKKNQGYDKS